MMISVIMPIYNVEEYLDDAVRSVICQTYGDWELLAIDDGSTDGSGRIIDEWAKRDTRIRVFHTANGGLSAARNFGLQNMTGEYIQFLDSDDWLAPTALEDALQEAENKNADLVIFDAFYEGMETHFHEKSSLPPGVYEPEFILEQLASLKIPPYAWNKFCEKSLYKDVFFPEGEKWEDVATTFYPVSRAKKIAVLGKALYYYRQRASAITKEALADHTVHKWRYLQYRRRYEFLEQYCPHIANEAKSSVMHSGLLYYAWFCPSMRKKDKDVLRTFLCSQRFRTGIASRKLRVCRFAFRLFPRFTGWAIRSYQRVKAD